MTAATNQLNRASGTSKNILIIEDDADTAEVLAVELLRAGYGVRKVASREDALAILDTYLYDYILMDYHMPGMKAGEFVDRARQKRPSLKVVLMTAGFDVAQHAAELGIEFCLPKPFDPVLVAQMLDQFTFDEGRLSNAS